MFKEITQPRELVTIYFEGRPLQAAAGATVAAAVLEAAGGWTRLTKSGHRRGPHCHIGVCHECLMNIDGRPNQQACLTIVAENMRVLRQDGVPSFGPKAAPEASND